MTIIRLRGIAYRDGLPWRSGPGPATIVPAAVPVWAGYDDGNAIGTAALRRDEAGIWADAAVEDGPWRETCRYFSMSFRCAHLAEVPGAGLGEAIGVSLTATTGDEGMPPFEVLSEPAG